MSKLTDFQTPTGAKGNLLSPASWVQMILGSMVLLVTFALGQHFTKKLGAHLPIDTSIDPIVNRPVLAASSAPQKMVF